MPLTKHSWAVNDIIEPAMPKGDGTDMSYADVDTVQRNMIGRRFLTWDGRIFRYSKSLGTIYSGFGAANIFPASNLGAVIPAAAAVGDRIISVTVGASAGYGADGAVAENELIGGYVTCGHGESIANTRRIEANTAVATGGGTMLVLLDAPIANAMTVSSSYVEVWPNPYKYLSNGSVLSGYLAFMCVPAVTVATGKYFWGQTRGPCWCVPGGGDGSPGDTASDRTVYFVGDGSVNAGYALTIETGYQKAGYIIDRTASGTSAGPLVMLELE